MGSTSVVPLLGRQDRRPSRSGTGTASSVDDRGLPGVWCPPSTHPVNPGGKGRSPRPATPTPAGSSSRLPGITAAPTEPGSDDADPLGPGSASCPSTRTSRQPSTSRWQVFNDRKKKPVIASCRRPRARRLVLVAGGAGEPRSTSQAPAGRGQSQRRNDPRNINPRAARRSRSISRPAERSTEQPSCGNQPAHISLTARRPRHADPSAARPINNESSLQDPPGDRFTTTT